jgi:hypothetical protein
MPDRPRPLTMSDRWSRFVPLTGVIFVALLVTTNVLFGSAPESGDSAAKVIAFYQAHRTRTEISSYLTGLSLFFGLFFYACLRDYLRRAKAGERLAATAFGGAVLFAVGGGLSAGLQFALADVPSKLSPAAAQALNLLENDMTVFALTAGIALLLMASGIAILRTRLLPVWLGWIAIVIAVVGLTPVGFFAFLAAGLWTLVTSILIYTHRDAATLVPRGETRAPAASPAV